MAEGANVNEKDEDGHTPASLLLNTYMCGVHNIRRVKMFKLLVDLGTDLYAENEDGINLLTLSLFHGFIWAAEYILEKGFDVNHRNNLYVTYALDCYRYRSCK